VSYAIIKRIKKRCEELYIYRFILFFNGKFQGELFTLTIYSIEISTSKYVVLNFAIFWNSRTLQIVHLLCALLYNEKTKYLSQIVLDIARFYLILSRN